MTPEEVSAALYPLESETATIALIAELGEWQVATQYKLASFTATFLPWYRMMAAQVSDTVLTNLVPLIVDGIWPPGREQEMESADIISRFLNNIDPDE